MSALRRPRTPPETANDTGFVPIDLGAFRGSRPLPQAFQSSAIQIERHAGDVARTLRAQENSGIGQFLWFSESVERVLARGESARLLRRLRAQFLFESLRILPPQISIYPAR